MIKINLENFKTKEAWLKLRKSGIGGSDAAVVANVSRYKSEMQLWLEKTGQTDDENEESEAAYWGTVLEDIIREEFNKRTGLNAVKPEFMYRHDTHSFMIANLDGEVEDECYGTCIFEAKTVSAFKREEWDNRIPFEYYLQLQHYMCVTGYEGAYIAALIGGNEFMYRFIERDEEVISMLVNLERAFLSKVKNMEEPDLDGSEACKNFLALKYPSATTEEPVDLGEEGASLLLHYDECLKQEKRAKEVKTYIENRLKGILQNHEIGIVGDRKVTWKNVISRRLDSKLLKVSEPDIYNEYSYDSTTRRFLIA